MSDYNNVGIIGRLTKDVELVNTQGTVIAKLSIANNEKFKDKEYVNFFDVKVFGKMAEVCGQYLTKGSQVCVDGSLRQERWKKDGKNYSKDTINASTIQFLGKSGNQQVKQQQNSQPVNNPWDSPPAGQPNDNDIPF